MLVSCSSSFGGVGFAGQAIRRSVKEASHRGGCCEGAKELVLVALEGSGLSSHASQATLHGARRWQSGLDEGIAGAEREWTTR